MVFATIIKLIAKDFIKSLAKKTLEDIIRIWADQGSSKAVNLIVDKLKLPIPKSLQKKIAKQILKLILELFGID